MISKYLTCVWLEFQKREENSAEEKLEAIMSKYIPSLMKDTFIQSRISINPKQGKYEENHGLAHHSQIMKNQRIKKKSWKQIEKALIYKETMIWWRQENNGRSSLEWLKKNQNPVHPNLYSVSIFSMNEGKRKTLLAKWELNSLAVDPHYNKC